MSLEITALYVGVNAALLVLLGAAVSLQRRRHRVSLGSGDTSHSGLLRAIRAHGNAAEHVPMALLVIAAAEAMEAPDTAVHLMGVVLTMGRLFHAYALLFKGLLLFRQLGVLFTWAVLLFGGIALAGHALQAGAGAELLPSMLPEPRR